MNLTLPRYMINKERRGNVEYTIPRPYPDICFIVNVWDVPILTHPRNNFRENSLSTWAKTKRESERGIETISSYLCYIIKGI